MPNPTPARAHVIAGGFNDIDVTWYWVSDVAQSKAWYQRVLGWPIHLDWPEAGWVELGPGDRTRLALQQWRGEGPLPPPGSGCAVFGVDDAHAVAAALADQGVRVDPV